MVTKEVIYDTHINHFNEYKVIKDLLPGIYICSNLNRLWYHYLYITCNLKSWDFKHFNFQWEMVLDMIKWKRSKYIKRMLKQILIKTKVLVTQNFIENI